VGGKAGKQGRGVDIHKVEARVGTEKKRKLIEEPWTGQGRRGGGPNSSIVTLNIRGRGGEKSIQPPEGPKVGQGVG